MFSYQLPLHATARHARPRKASGAPQAAALAAAVAAAVCLWVGSANARCVDEDAYETGPGGNVAEGAATADPAQAPLVTTDPRTVLQTLVRDALERSHAVGAANMLAAAAQSDIEEAAAGQRIQASLTAGVGPGGSQSLAGTETSAIQVRAALTVSQLLYDGGRVDRLTDWRTQLAESARQGHLSASEQLAMTTVSLALERSRYRQHVVVYGQYVRKMACLAEALEAIVRTDRGRASELVQAQKNLQQAELAQSQAMSQARQVEVRLRRLVGDGLPAAQGLSSLFLQVPPLEQLIPEVELSSEIAGLTAQAQAASHYAKAVAAGSKPQLSWTLTGSQSVGNGGSVGTTRNGNYAVGLAVTIPLLNPGVTAASDAAQKRARAAELQRAEALESRRFRVAEVHEQTSASFDRARRVAGVLRESEQVRNFTLQQWQQLGRRSLFDVMGAESEHYNLRISYVNALHDGQQLNANLQTLGRGVREWLK